MKKAKRIVSLVLALSMVLVAMFTLVACSGEQTPDDYDCKAEGHKYKAGVCSVCGAIEPIQTWDCETQGHRYQNRVCSECGVKEPYDCTVSGHLYKNGVCSECGHVQGSGGAVVPEHKHSYGVDGYCVCGEVDPKATFTRQLAMVQSPNVWNPFTYKSTNDSLILDYTTGSLYGIDYKDLANPSEGFAFVPSMAAAEPVDVTAQYAGQYGLEEGDKNKAWRIELKEGLMFEDGTPITAETYVESFRRLLDPEMANSRAGNYYTSVPAIAGAENYAKSDWQKWMAATETPVGEFDLSSIPAEYAERLIFTISTSGYQYGSKETDVIVSDARGYMNAIFSGDPSSVEVIRLIKALGVSVTQEQLDALEGQTIAAIAADAEKSALVNEIFNAFNAYYGLGMKVWVASACVIFWEFPHYEFEEEVGVIASEDGKYLDIIYTTELIGFKVMYSIGLPLVHIEKYDASMSVDSTTGAKTCSYGTTYESYIGCSYGPYKLTKFAPDQQIVFERNENWYGYSEAYAEEYGTFEKNGKTYRQYQTDKIVITQAAELSTREQMFLSGQLDSLGLDAEKLEEYDGSSRLQQTVGETTFYGIINGNYEALKARQDVYNAGLADLTYVNTILANPKFRQALSYAINREEYCRQAYPAGTPAFSLYSASIIADPENGLSYYDFDCVKEAICEVWGVEYGADKEFKTLDEAFAKIKGYDLATAKKLVTEAYEEELEAGRITSTSIVKIYHNTSVDNSTTRLDYDTYKSFFMAMVEGTPLEGRFEYEFDYSLGNDFSAGIQAGLTDCAWGFGWSGSALDPWGLFEVYIDAAYGGDYQYDYYNNWSQLIGDITIKVDLEDGEGEKEHTYNIVEWWQITQGLTESYIVKGKELPNGGYGFLNDSARALILSELEKEMLLQYCTIPVMVEGSVGLNSYKIQNYSDTYIYGIGRGGIRYGIHNYTDAEWVAFVKSQNGLLNYKI